MEIPAPVDPLTAHQRLERLAGLAALRRNSLNARSSSLPEPSSHFNAGPVPSAVVLAPTPTAAAATPVALELDRVQQDSSSSKIDASLSVIELGPVSPSQKQPRKPPRVRKVVYAFSEQVVAVATELKNLASSGNLVRLTQRLQQLRADNAFGGVLGLPCNRYERLIELITPGQYISDGMLEPFIHDHPLPGGCEVMDIVLLEGWFKYDNEAWRDQILRLMIDRPPIRKLFFLGGGNGHFFPVWMDSNTKKIYYYDSMGWSHDEFMALSRPALARLVEPLGWEGVQHWGIVRVKGPRQEECECLLITWTVIKVVAFGEPFPKSWNGWAGKNRFKLFVELMDLVVAGAAD